jgi:hypothetical protein
MYSTFDTWCPIVKEFLQTLEGVPHKMAGSGNPEISTCFSEQICPKQADMAKQREYIRSVVPTLYVELKPRLSVVQFVLYGCLKRYRTV